MAANNVSLTELRGLAKPIVKLIDAVRAATGMLYLPTHIRRMAAAKADAATIKASSDAKVAAIKAYVKVEQAIFGAALDDDTIESIAAVQQRLLVKEARRLENIHAIADQAAEELPETVEEAQVDEDWMAAFLEQGQDVSDEQMRSVWAKILANEVAKPGSFCLRTLTVVKHLQKHEADLFTRLASTCWSIGGRLMPLVYADDLVMSHVGLSYEDFLLLDTIGLITFQDIGEKRLSFQGPLPIRIIAIYFGRPHLIQLEELATSMSIGRVMLSTVGEELLRISGSTANEVLRLQTIAKWLKEGLSVTDIPVNPSNTSPPPGTGSFTI